MQGYRGMAWHGPLNNRRRPLVWWAHCSWPAIACDGACTGHPMVATEHLPYSRLLDLRPSWGAKSEQFRSGGLALPRYAMCTRRVSLTRAEAPDC
jgi:hypothetical protein